MGPQYLIVKTELKNTYLLHQENHGNLTSDALNFVVNTVLYIFIAKTESKIVKPNIFGLV